MHKGVIFNDAELEEELTKNMEKFFNACGGLGYRRDVPNLIVKF